MNIKRLALGDQRIPHFDGVDPGHPHFESQIARISCARNVHRYACNLSMRHVKIFQVGDVRVGRLVQHFRGHRPL